MRKNEEPITVESKEENNNHEKKSSAADQHCRRLKKRLKRVQKRDKKSPISNVITAQAPFKDLAQVLS